MTTRGLRTTYVDRSSDILASVIVLNWNGERFLGACLDSLRRQTFTGLETILVDNGSTDGSVELVKRDFHDVKVVALDRNIGFSAGNNEGIRRARGRYVALMNNDAEADPHWIEEIVKAFERHPEIGMCASKILLYDNRALADSCGDFYSVEGVAGKIGHLESQECYEESREVFGACAGAAIYRRSMLEELGGFDEDFFIVHEDSDLNFRAQLLGYRCIYVPTAVVYHHLGATIGKGSDRAVYFSQRNTEFVYLKNMPLVLLLKYWPLHVLADVVSFGAHIARGKTRAFISAKLDALRMMPGVIRKRRQIQKARRASAADIDRWLERGWLWERLHRGLDAGMWSQQAQPGASGEERLGE